MDNINMEMVEKLLAGRNRIKEMNNKLRQEIDDFTDMIFSLLTKAELSRFKFGQVVCSFESAGLYWEVEKLKGDYIHAYIGVTAKPKSSSVYESYISCSPPRDTIPKQYLQSIHQGLPIFLANMVKVFPGLEERFVPFLKAASGGK